jgi:hypothetical protein
MDENPYAVTGSLTAPLPDAPMDPEIMIGEHQYPLFSPSWWLQAVGLYAACVACALFLLSQNHVLVMLLLLVSYFAWLLFASWREYCRLRKWLLNKHALSELPDGARIVSIIFDKSLTNRPKRRGLRRLLPIDDIGLLLVDHDGLRYLGDAVTMTLSNEDIAAVESARLWGMSGYTRVCLDRRISGHVTIVFSPYEWRLWRLFRTLRELRQELDRLSDLRA